MTCANFQTLRAGTTAGANNTQIVISPIGFPYDNEADLRLDIYDYGDQRWVNVPIATGLTLNVDSNPAGSANTNFYSWEVFDNAGVRAVRTVLATAGTTPALPAGGTARHPYTPNNNIYPVEGGAGRNVRLYRTTSIDAGDMPATFYPGSAVKAEDLNDNFEALRKVVEESACSTNNINDGIPQLDQRYWNKLDETLEDGDAWVSDDAHIATTAAGDARWLNAVGGDIVGGPGIETTEAGGNVTISVDLDTPSGLETDPAGNTGELRINVNSGCEIVADGLNAETTAASIVQTGGDNDDPAIRVATTLGAATTNNDLVITGGDDITVTRNSATELTIASTATGDTYDLNASDDGDNVDLNLTSGSGDDNSTVQLTAGAGINIDHTSNNEITFSVAQGAALWQNDNGTLEPTDDGRNVRVNNGDGNQTILLNADGSAVFNDTGGSFDFRVAGENQANLLFVDGSADRVGINTATPGAQLDVNGNAQITGNAFIRTGNNVQFNNANNNQNVRINADDCSESYTVTLPPTAPTANGQVLSVASGTTDAELAWADGGGAGNQDLADVCGNGFATTTNIVVAGDVDDRPNTDATDSGVQLLPSGRATFRSAGADNICVGIASGNRFWVGPGDAADANDATFSVANTGTLSLANGAGIDFSAHTGGTNTSNTTSLLDDYEEGDWAPTFEGSAVSGTYIATNGHFDYVKVGNMITVFGRCGFSTASGGTGSFIIGRLPYAYAANNSVVGVIEWDNIAFNGDAPGRPTTVVIMQRSDASSSLLQIVFSGDTEGAVVLNASQITTDSFIRFSITYRVA